MTFAGTSFTLPKWSVLIVDGASLQVLFNTAVTSPASAAAAARRAPAAEAEAVRARVEAAAFYPEVMGGWSGLPSVQSPTPAEQLSVTRDATDYLWYSTRVPVPPAPRPATLTLTLSAVQDYVYVALDGVLQAASMGKCALRSAVRRRACLCLALLCAALRWAWLGWCLAAANSRSYL